jgi:hypothetical protein
VMMLLFCGETRLKLAMLLENSIECDFTVLSMME